MSPSQSLQPHYDAVVIGSGHNGLVAAAYLAGAGKSVLVLERNDYPGGATTSHRVFPDYDAQLSRYAYLISLLPEQIRSRNWICRSRHVDDEPLPLRPTQMQHGIARGLVLSNVDEQRSRSSMFELTGSEQAWKNYQQLLSLETTMAKIAWPTMLQPLKSRGEFERGLTTPEQKEAWQSFIERPLGEVIERYAEHDVLRGLLMTDGKIGVFTDPHDESLLQNRCFLYHVIGNETGRVASSRRRHEVAGRSTGCSLSRTRRPYCDISTSSTNLDGIKSAYCRVSAG
jgi:phytoene dehydrogenase-like protein